MTISNRLTLLRAFLSIVVYVCIVTHGLGFKIAALVAFGIAGLTDWLDGKIARQTNTVTSFGAIADSFVDKILVIAAFAAFASIKELNVPIWAVILIVARELMLSSLRALAGVHGKLLSAERAGKLKTGFQIFAIIAILLIMIVQSLVMKAPYPLLMKVADYTNRMPFALTLITVALTWLSGIMYLINHWQMIKDSWSAKQTKTDSQ
jgi:CDP-diacylglycerol---glycerol-3-phosphate 3-phosphatidyltransferase